MSCNSLDYGLRCAIKFKLVRQQFSRVGEVVVVGVAVGRFWETRLLPLIILSSYVILAQREHAVFHTTSN